MQNGILIFLSVLCFSASQIMTRLFQTRLQIAKHSVNLFQALFSFVAAVAYFGVAIASKNIFSYSLLIPAVLFGGCFALASLFSAKCMELGYMSLSSVIINLSLIIPVIFSWIALGEEVTPKSVCGLGLIIITLVLSSLSAENDKNCAALRWLAFVIIAFFANGGSAVVQKRYKTSYGESNLMLFMAAAYTVSALIFSVNYLILNKGSKQSPIRQIKKPALAAAFAVFAGLGSFGGNGLLGYLCDKVNGGILYPCLNGGLSIAVAVTSFVFFKERLTLRKIAAIATGVAAIVLLSI